MPNSALSGVIALLAAVTIPCIAQAAEPRTLEAAEAVDVAWSAAETRGDTAFLESMLAPEYRSVSATGKVTPKAAIVEHARKTKIPSRALKLRDRSRLGARLILIAPRRPWSATQPS